MEMEKLFDNEEYNYSVRYYEKIVDDLFKTTIRAPENIELPKSNTLSISTIKKELETKENLNHLYIEDEFNKVKNKIHEFNQKKYPNYEDMDLKLILSKIKGIEDFNALNDIYDKIKEGGRLETLKKNIEKELDKVINPNEKDFKLQEEIKMKLEKGNVIKTDLSDNTMVLDMDNKEKQAVLFTGTQFVIASGIKLNDKTGKFEWDNGRYANDIKTISDIKNNKFEIMKDTVSFLAEYNHKDFAKAIISLETGIENEDVLDNAYDNYINDYVMGLVDEKFYDYIDDEDLEKGIVDKEKTVDNSKEDLGNKQPEKEKVTEQKSEKPKTIDVKGDFVKLSGQEKKTTDKDRKEYISLKVNEAKPLKAKQQEKQETNGNDKISVIGKLNKYKQRSEKIKSEPVKKLIDKEI